MLNVLKETFLEIGGLKALDLVEGENAVLVQQFVQEFGLNESGDIDGPGEVGEARSFWNDS